MRLYRSMLFSLRIAADVIEVKDPKFNYNEDQDVNRMFMEIFGGENMFHMFL